jgi:hypothetical protein
MSNPEQEHIVLAISMADSILDHSQDMNIQNEMTAILIESNPYERVMGAQMLSLQWIEFLASIGYQKQTIYIFRDNEENCWMGLKNKGTNPYQSQMDVQYQPIQILQELN